VLRNQDSIALLLHDGLAEVPVQPGLQDLEKLNKIIELVAEGEGFEPSGRRRPLVFKTSALNRSATPPEINQ
jgi:hypothetical protein